MAAAADMPDIKSGRLMQLSELASWAPNDVHGNAVRVLGRVKRIDRGMDMLIIEYHREELLVLAEYLKPHGLREGMLLQFLGELHRKEDKLVLKARLCRDMTGLDTDLYDRCLKIRREFENRVLPTYEPEP